MHLLTLKYTHTKSIKYFIVKLESPTDPKNTGHDDSCAFLAAVWFDEINKQLLLQAKEKTILPHFTSVHRAAVKSVDI